MPKCPTLSGSLCLTLCDNIRIPFQSSSSNSALLYAYNAGPCSHKPLVCHKHTHTHTRTHARTHTHTVSCCLSSHVFHSCWISRLDSDPKSELLQITGTSSLQVANHSCQRWKRNLKCRCTKKIENHDATGGPVDPILSCSTNWLPMQEKSPSGLQLSSSTSQLLGWQWRTPYTNSLKLLWYQT